MANIRLNGGPGGHFTLTGLEEVPMMQSGVDGYATTQEIADLAAGGTAPVVTDAATALTATDANSGNYTRFTSVSAKAYTFDSAESYTVGDEYHGRNVGAGDLALTEAGTFVLNAPNGGTLVIPAGGTFTVKIVAAAEADVFGVTVAA